MLHDENYKRLFGFRLMVEHLLRACLPGDLVAAADLSSLRKLSTAYVSDELRKRHGDTVWRVPVSRRWVFLLLVEFQSEDDQWMALRVLTYTGLLLQELVRNEAPEVADGRLPAVLPVVLHNGDKAWQAARGMGELITPVGRWLAPYQPEQRYHVVDLRHVAAEDFPRQNLLRAVAQLEQSRTPADVLRVAEELSGRLRERGMLERAFVDWMRQMAERLAPRGAKVPPVRTLEEIRMTLVERVSEWPAQWVQEGRRQGLEQGVAQQREMLCRQAASRFGTEAADRLVVVLAPISDPARLAEVGDWLVRCETGGEFLARVSPAS